MDPNGFDVDSEFASVRIEAVERNGRLVQVVDRRTGAARCVDALVIEGLVYASDAALAMLVDPAARWLADDDEPAAVTS